MSNEYLALTAKVGSFLEATAARRRDDLACTKGCDGCCQVWLTVSPVEAAQVEQGLARLPAETRARIAARGRQELEREGRGEDAARCALLEDDGTCAVYEQRPLVCRTQGHALRYPAGFIPLDAVRQRMPNGEVTCCPLNYTERAPRAEDVLDAERVDQLLALVNHRYAAEKNVGGAARQAISELAARADMLGCAEAPDD